AWPPPSWLRASRRPRFQKGKTRPAAHAPCNDPRLPERACRRGRFKKGYATMKVISVKFKENGRAYYFDPGTLEIRAGDFVVVTTARGTECGEVVRGPHEVPGYKREIKPVLRMADAVDVRRMRQNRADVQQAFEVCEQRIEAYGRKMKLVDAEYTLDRNKLVFYFTADNRVDFSELVKDLAAQFHTRIELRQIGVRDESKMLGGLGLCGQPFCCSRFLKNFQPVSIKM